MKIREMINYIIENRDKEDMLILNDMLNNLICDLKENNPKLYYEYKTKLYEIAYGKVILPEKAEEIVKNMIPYGEHYSIERAKEITSEYNLKHSVSDVYLVLNSIYNDYCSIYGEDNDENYIKMTKAWLDDKDAIDDKVYVYFMNIPKEK